MKQSNEDHYNISSSKKILLALKQAKNKLIEIEQQKSEPIAIVGIGCRFPGEVNSTDDFWEKLINEFDAINEVGPDRWDSNIYYDPDPEVPGKMYTKSCGLLKNIDHFDADFFGFSPKEAQVMDPQQKLVLEVCWEAMENAGYYYDRIVGDNTGVFIGVTANDYSQHLLKNVGIYEMDAYVLTGNVHNAIAGRVSYLFGFNGPCISIDTACSSSLVSVHFACQSIHTGECDQALAGGVNVLLGPEGMIATSKARILSPDGKCKTFDKSADGMGRGEGCGIVLLKRLSKAVDDRDSIYAVIRSTSTNHGGASGGFTIPNMDAQAKVITKALKRAKIGPHEISYVEVHGTGTELGDSIEVEALGSVLCEQRPSNDPLIIGTVKTNMGHLESASGIAGIIKVALSLKHRIIPKHLHLNENNPNIPWNKYSIKVAQETLKWETKNKHRFAGVSGFGFSGINAHAILEEYSESNSPLSTRPWHIITLSAKTEEALKMATDNLVSHFEKYPETNIADAAFTLNIGRKKFNHRRVLLCRNSDDIINVHKNENKNLVFSNYNETLTRSVVFMFGGVGDQYINMARTIYEKEKVFREHVDNCCNIIKKNKNYDLLDIIFSKDKKHDRKNSVVSENNISAMVYCKGLDDDEPTQKLNQTIYVHPAIFVIEYALAKLWISWGIKPSAMIGYSIGEYVAACIADVMTIEDAIMTIIKRAELINALDNGEMIAIAASEEEVNTMLTAGASLAIINSPMMCIVSGTEESLLTIKEELSKRNIFYKKVSTSHPFHSYLLEPIYDDLLNYIKSIDLKPPRIPYISNITGSWISREEAVDPEYWVKHTCETVRFSDGIMELLKNPNRLFLEIGPGQSLCSFVVQQPKETSMNYILLSSIPNKNDSQSDDLFLYKSLSRLWLYGVSIDWNAFYLGESRKRIALPSYPFIRQRYWIDKGPSDINILESLAMTKNPDISEWFYFPLWKQTLQQSDDIMPQTIDTLWIIFIDEYGVSTQICKILKEQNQKIINVNRGAHFCRKSKELYVINPENIEDYHKLFSEIKSFSFRQIKIIQLWNLILNDDAENHSLYDKQSLKESQYRGFYSLLFIAQSLGHNNIKKDVDIGIVTNNLYRLINEEVNGPERATLAGACKVIPLEISNVKCSNIDILLPIQNNIENMVLFADRIIGELNAGLIDNIVALRAKNRWVQIYEPSRIESVQENKVKIKIRKEGVYLITGGLGGLGLAAAEHLGSKYKAKIILIGRSSFPDKTVWDEYLDLEDRDNEVCKKIKRLKELEKMGAEIAYFQADVSSIEDIKHVVTSIIKMYGKINGVFHIAGVPGAGILQLKSISMVEDVFLPKVTGTMILAEVIKDVPIDFMVLYSSKTSVCGIFGQIDYCAANMFLDVYANNRFNSKNIISINWDEWEWDSWSNNAMDSNSELYNILQQHRIKYGLSFSEGMEALTRIISRGLPQVAVSTRNLQQVIAEHRSYTSDNILDGLSKLNIGKKYPRPILGVDFVPPNNNIEKSIEKILCELLGFEEIGIYDNIFDLGANSLIGMQFISKLYNMFQITVSPKNIFEMSTIYELALLIEDMIIDNIDKLSDEEATSLIIASENI